MFKQKNTLAKAIFCTLVLFSNTANAVLVFTFEAAGVQSTTVPAGEVKTETFDTRSGTAPFTSAIGGSFSGSYTIKTADQYGGAGGNTKYIFSSNNTTSLLSFPNPIGYFGFWWSAGDSGNKLDIITVDGVVHNFTTATLLTPGLLTPSHKGNPNPAFLGKNNTQPYVFLNFFATDEASKIKSIKLGGTNFESDNHTTAANLQKITGKLVPGTCSAPQSAGTYPYCGCPTATPDFDAATNSCKAASVINTPTVDTITSDNSHDAAHSIITSPWTQIAIEDTTPTIQGTVGAAVLGTNTFAVTLTNNGSTISTGASPTYSGTTWFLAVQTPLAAGVYEVNAVRTAGGTVTSDATHNELVIGVPYCNGGVSGYILRTDFDGTKDAATYYLGACGSAVAKTSPNTYPDDLQPQKSVSTGVCTDAEGGGDRNTSSISTATIKRATIINATTLGGTTTKNLGDTVINYGERSGGTMDISNAVVTNGVAKNVTLTGATINNLYLDIAGSFDISTGTFSPSDTYIGVIDGTVGVTQPSGDGFTIPKSQIIDGVVTSGTAVDMPIRGKILAGFYNVNTSPTTMTLTKGRRATGTLIGATITGATTTTASVNGAIKTVVSGGTITNGSFAVTSTFGTATNAKIENATITSVNSCFTSGIVGERGQLNWKEVIQ